MSIFFYRSELSFCEIHLALPNMCDIGPIKRDNEQSDGDCHTYLAEAQQF
jgi:hypothetical protein